MTRATFTAIAAVAVAAMSLTACSFSDVEEGVAEGGDAGEADIASTAAADAYPEILEVVPTLDSGTGLWSFAVTVSSTYDTPERYADGWRVLGPDGTVYGVHTLTHDHASEQPFTRRQTGVDIPPDVTEVTIEGRDLANGFGGITKTISLQAAP